MTRKDIISMRNGGSTMNNNNQYWSEEARNQLDRLFHEGHGITEIAYLLERTEPAIVQMLMKEGYFQHEVKTRNRIGRSDKCICNKCSGYGDCPYSPQNRPCDTEISDTGEDGADV